MTGPRTLRHERTTVPAPAPTDRQRLLYSSVVMRASSIDEQLLILRTEATRVGASERDVRAVRERLLAGHVRECNG